VGTIIARGNLKSVQVEGSGVSKIYLKGSMRSVYVRLAGISEVFVDPSSGTAAARSQPHIQLQHTTKNACAVTGVASCHIHSIRMPNLLNADKQEKSTSVPRLWAARCFMWEWIWHFLMCMPCR